MLLRKKSSANIANKDIIGMCLTEKNMIVMNFLARKNNKIEIGALQGQVIIHKKNKCDTYDGTS